MNSVGADVRRLSLSFLLAISAWGGEWPQFLGTSRNGTTLESVAGRFPRDGPRQIWDRKVGGGFSGPVVARGKLVIFHRLGNQEVITALEAGSGKELWEYRYPTAYVDSFGFDAGPRGTPSVSDDRVFTFGAEGRLTCLSLDEGQKRWDVDTRAQYHADQGFFGMACSPLVMSNRVLLNLGGKPGAGVAAFDTDSGRLAWKATDHEAGYASPIPAELAGRPSALCFTREGLVGIELANGQVHFTFPWRSRMHASVNAASPVAAGGQVFLSASYGTGATLLRLRAGQVDTVWQGDQALSAHYATPVLCDGHLYGFHGRQEQKPSLRCVEWESGKVRWSEDSYGAGTLALAGDRLVILLETGELVLADTSPASYREQARAQVLGKDTRAPFALADGRLFARDKTRLACFDLGPAP